MSNQPRQLYAVPASPLAGPVEESVRRELAWLMRQAEAGRVHAVAVVYIRTDEDGEEQSGRCVGFDTAAQAERLSGLLSLAQLRILGAVLEEPPQDDRA